MPKIPEHVLTAIAQKNAQGLTYAETSEWLLTEYGVRMTPDALAHALMRSRKKAYQEVGDRATERLLTLEANAWAEYEQALPSEKKQVEARILRMIDMQLRHSVHFETPADNKSQDKEGVLERMKAQLLRQSTTETTETPEAQSSPDKEGQAKACPQSARAEQSSVNPTSLGSTHSEKETS